MTHIKSEHFERTIRCGLVSQEYLEKTITLAGWVNKRRDHGGLIFIDLRDRSGIMQIVFNPDFSHFLIVTIFSICICPRYINNIFKRDN